MPEFAAAEIRGRSFKILADVELADDFEGVLLANGARFGGHTLFLKDRKLWYVNNFLGIPPEQQLSPRTRCRPGRTCSGWSSRRRATVSTARPWAPRRSTSTTLAVAKSEWKTQPGPLRALR